MLTVQVSHDNASRDVAGVVEEYLRALESSRGRTSPFLRARAVNRAKERCIREGTASMHLMFAFDLYGYG